MVRVSEGFLWKMFVLKALENVVKNVLYLSVNVLSTNWGHHFYVS